MNFCEMFKKDMIAISAEVGQVCTLRGRKICIKVNAVVSDEQSANAGYSLLDGRTVSATATFDAGRSVNDICIGDSFVVGATSYRVSNITRTAGDTIVSVSLSVEGKR